MIGVKGIKKYFQMSNTKSKNNSSSSKKKKKKVQNQQKPLLESELNLKEDSKIPVYRVIKAANSDGNDKNHPRIAQEANRDLLVRAVRLYPSENLARWAAEKLSLLSNQNDLVCKVDTNESHCFNNNLSRSIINIMIEDFRYSVEFFVESKLTLKEVSDVENFRLSPKNEMHCEKK